MKLLTSTDGWRLYRDPSNEREVLLEVRAGDVAKLELTPEQLRLRLPSILFERLAEEWAAAHEALRAEQRSGTVQDFIDEVAKAHQVSTGRVLADRASARAQNVRHLLMYLLREHMDLSFPQIGNIFGMHHSTVIRQHRRVSKALKSRNKSWKAAVEQAEAALRLAEILDSKPVNDEPPEGRDER